MHPDMVRVLAAAFGMAHLPNRVEIRLKSTDRVIGYTLSHIRDSSGLAHAALRCSSRTSRTSSRSKSASACAIALPRSARWPRRWPTS